MTAPATRRRIDRGASYVRFPPSRSADRSAAPDERPAPFPVGAYLTDGTRLFRAVRTLPGAGDGGAMLLEDCLTLELVVERAGDLADRDLRPVTPLSP